MQEGVPTPYSLPGVEENVIRTIFRDTLVKAVQDGIGVAHLSPGQVWAVHWLVMPPERLEKSLPPSWRAIYRAEVGTEGARIELRRPADAVVEGNRQKSSPDD